MSTLAKYILDQNVRKLPTQLFHAVLLYLDKATSFKDPLPFVFDLKPIDEIRSWVIERLDKIRQLVEPERVITKYCNYCPFKKTCNPPQELIPKWTS